MPRIDTFKFSKGKWLAKKYRVIERIGDGWEGEVYLVREKGTRVSRAAKLFFPHRDKKGKTTRFTARKLHKLRKCGIMMHYHTQEQIMHGGVAVKMLVSEYIEGEILEKFVKSRPGKRLTPYEGLHLLRALAEGISCIHERKEYHGDIHEGNIMVNRRGVWFDVKLVDLYNYGRATSELISGDVIDIIRVFYDSLGGQKRYASQPWFVKEICCGLKKGLITKKFRTAGDLVRHLDSFEWD